MESIYYGKNTLRNAEEDQSNLLNNKGQFNDKTRLKTKENKMKKKKTFDSMNAFHEGPELTLNHFKSKIFSQPKKSQGTGKVLKTNASKITNNVNEIR